MMKTALALLLVVAVRGDVGNKQELSVRDDLQSALDQAEQEIDDEAQAMGEAFGNAKKRFKRILESIGEFVLGLVAVVITMAEIGELLSDANVEMFIQCVNSTLESFQRDNPNDPFFDVCPMYCLTGNACQDVNNPDYDVDKCKICNDPCGCKGQAPVKLAELARPCCTACASDQWALPPDEADLKPRETCDDFQSSCRKLTKELRENMTDELKQQGCAVPETFASEAGRLLTPPSTAKFVVEFVGRYVMVTAGILVSVMVALRMCKREDKDDVFDDAGKYRTLLAA